MIPVSGELLYSTNFTGNNGSADLTSIGTAGITLATDGGTIDLNGNAVTYAGSIGNNGILTLLGANTNAGDTTITNVSLLVNNLSGAATGGGNVTIQNGATLSGTGALGGSVTVADSATLAPGRKLGVLSVGKNFTLAAGSKTLMQVQHSPLTNNAVHVSGTLTQGDALVVTNGEGITFTAGDSFNLFHASAPIGAFDSISLPPLNPGLFWRTSQLATDGIIGVVSTNPPAINSVEWSAGNLVFQGTGGTPNWDYLILTSTNLTLPLPQWIITATNYFDASGNFT